MTSQFKKIDDTRSTAIYSRVSTLSQNIEGQIRDLEQYCHHRGWTNTKIFSEKFTGTTQDRPVYKKLKEEIANGKIERVVIVEISRLSRVGVTQVIQEIQFMLDHNCLLVSKNEALDFSGHLGQAMAGILGALARIDYEHRRERILIGIDNARQKNGGKCHWARPKQRSTKFDDTIVLLRQQGYSYRKIASNLQISLGRVERAIYALQDSGRLERPTKKKV